MVESLAAALPEAYHRAVRSRVRLLHVIFVMALIALPSVLSALAYANPPDPAWIAGVWDDDDQDNVIVFLTSATALSDPRPGTFGPDWSVGELLALPLRLSPRHDSPLPFHLRAPPRG